MLKRWPLSVCLAGREYELATAHIRTAPSHRSANDVPTACFVESEPWWCLIPSGCSAANPSSKANPRLQQLLGTLFPSSQQCGLFSALGVCECMRVVLSTACTCLVRKMPEIVRSCHHSFFFDRIAQFLAGYVANKQKGLRSTPFACLPSAPASLAPTPAATFCRLFTHPFILPPEASDLHFANRSQGSTLRSRNTVDRHSNGSTDGLDEPGIACSARTAARSSRQQTLTTERSRHHGACDGCDGP